VKGRHKSTLAAVAIIVGALALWGCTTTQVIDQTQDPYASISDEGRDPPALATPPQPQTDDDSNSRGFFGSIAHFFLVGLGFHVD
jgi:hypothetical protein